MDQRLGIITIEFLRFAARDFCDLIEGVLGTLVEIKRVDFDIFALEIGALLQIVCGQHPARDEGAGYNVRRMHFEFIEFVAFTCVQYVNVFPSLVLHCSISMFA